jgi:hypothetical protein
MTPRTPKELRLAAGLSIERCAVAAGVTSPTIRLFEADPSAAPRARPKLETFYRQPPPALGFRHHQLPLSLPPPREPQPQPREPQPPKSQKPRSAPTLESARNGAPNAMKASRTSRRRRVRRPSSPRPLRPEPRVYRRRYAVDAQGCVTVDLSPRRPS